MSRYSELADDCDNALCISARCYGLHKKAAAALRELEAENRLYSDALANYEQHDHEVKEENVALRTRVAELEADRKRVFDAGYEWAVMFKGTPEQGFAALEDKE